MHLITTPLTLDRHAIVQMSLCCAHLQHLTFSACSFLDYGALHRELLDYYQAGGLDTAEEMELDLLLRDQEVCNNQVRGIWYKLCEIIKEKMKNMFL